MNNHNGDTQFSSEVHVLAGMLRPYCVDQHLVVRWLRGVARTSSSLVKLKTDGINPVSSATVYRIFPFVFIFYGINGNGTDQNGSRIENGRAFVRSYLRSPVFYRSIPFFIKTGK